MLSDSMVEFNVSITFHVTISIKEQLSGRISNLQWPEKLTLSFSLWSINIQVDLNPSYVLELMFSFVISLRQVMIQSIQIIFVK